MSGAAPTPAVIIVGGGPAGLTAAAALAPHVDGEVVVLEREATAGGIPRHTDHPGYGIRDRRTFLSGPTYARRLVQDALASGARICTQTMVTGWAGPHTLEVTSPFGLDRLTAPAIVLATGARERPRSARLVPGDRPAGVYTTGQLQNAVHAQARDLGTRAVIVGAEAVSWSAALTLRAAHVRTVQMVTEYRRPEAVAAFTGPGRLALRVPVATRTRIVGITGRGRVEAVDVEHLATGARRRIACDTVVFTGDWIPDHELARAAGLELDPHTLGPLVDYAQRTSSAGVFAIGNLTHPVDTADVAALDGRAVADAVVAQLRTGGGAASGLRVGPGPSLRWISPGLRPADGSRPPRNRLLSWPVNKIRTPTVTVAQNGRVVTSRRLRWSASPGRVFRIPADLLDTVDPQGGPVVVDIV